MADTRKRVAVLVGQADESYQRRFLEGFLEQTFGFDMDVCVFSMYRKYQDTKERERGEANIFSMVNPDFFDAFVFLKDCVQTNGIAEQIEEKLHASFNGPVLVVEKESKYFPSVCSDGYTPIVTIVNHLIEMHGFHDIAFLTGKRWHPHSQQRLNAYKEALASHGIPVREDLIVYGDFWYKSGEHCAEHLLLLDHLPEAVVCANDPMAIGLCSALEKRGIHVPEDIVVVGYDSTEEGQTSPKTITSALIPAKEVGLYSADYIEAQLSGREIPPFYAKSELMIGESCGCKRHNMPSLSKKRKEWETDTSEEGYLSINNMMMENFLKQGNLRDFLAEVHSYAYQIKEADSFHLLLNSQWKNMHKDSDLLVPNDGYSDKMIYGVRYNKTQKDSILGLSETFPLSDMLPDLLESREKPSVYYFTPVFCEQQCYGYAAVCYEYKARSYDDVYRMWIDTVMYGLESLRRRLVANLLKEKLEKLRSNQYVSAMDAYDSLSSEEKEDYDLVKKILDENLLTYHFQPIVRAQDGSIYSYEALMRSKTDSPVSPLDIIKYAEMQGRLIDVERATFLNVLGIVDSQPDLFKQAKVFVNSIPGVRLYDSDYEEMERLLSRNSEITVVELTEESEVEDEELQALKNFYEGLHIEIAIDDYGTGYSNVNNLLRYMPNYVKIDRALLSNIQNTPQKQHFVREVIEFCHDNNILALAEGVETTEELRTVIHLGADLIQGFYVGRPSAELSDKIDSKVSDEIRAYYKEHVEGVAKHTYIAGMAARVSLSALIRSGYSDIVVGHGNMLYKDVTIIGTPNTETDLHLTIEDNYSGVITLQNISFSNSKDHPCIDIGENCTITLVLQGENKLNGTGIRVPQSSALIFEGDGDLQIKLTEPEYYGIGNSWDAYHGTLDFEQDGAIRINANGRKGVLIGSGQGGNLIISRGQYVLHAGGDLCIGIGSGDGMVNIDIMKCMIDIDFTALHAVGIGSLNSFADLSISSSALHFSGGGSQYVGIGTLDGQYASLFIKEASMDISLRSEDSTCLGSLRGTTEFTAYYANLVLENAGKKSLILGGSGDESGQAKLRDSVLRVELHSGYDKDTFIPDENIRIENGRYTIMINDQKYERKVVFRNN